MSFIMFKKQIPSKNIPKKLGSTNIKPYWQVIKDIVKESDLLLEILDARMPEISRNSEIEEIIKTATEKKGRGEETNELELVFLSLNKRGLISSIEERARKKEKYFEQQGGCIDRTLYVVQPCILHKGNPLQSAILIYG